MEPNIPTSFIPKRPVENVPEARVSSHPFGLLSLLTVVIFIATALAIGGVFIYERQLAATQIQMQQKINDARQGLGLSFVSDMKELDNRITGIKDLLQNHIVVTPIFTALQASTLRSVQYKNFTYSFVSAGAISPQKMVQVQMTGTAKNYETIALQSDAFAKSNFIKDAVFSNLTVDDKKGVINFNLRFSVDASALSYQSFIDTLQNPNPGQNVTTNTPQP